MATIQKKSFWRQYGGLILILGGIAIGALIGAFAPSVGTTIKPIGDIFLNLLFTIVVPLVFVSIASAVGGMANMKRLGRILGSTVGTFIFTGLIACGLRADLGQPVQPLRRRLHPADHRRGRRGPERRRGAGQFP